MSKRKTELKFTIGLDEKNIPEEIIWEATDAENQEEKECKAIMVSLWDKKENNTLRIDLWTKEMMVEDYANYYLQTLMTTAEAFQKATGNPIAVVEMKKFCEEFAKKTNDLLEKEGKLKG